MAKVLGPRDVAPETDYPSCLPFMINLIVDDIEGVLATAKPGAQALGRQDEDYGRFARLTHPAGVKVELWQPLHGAKP